MNLDQLPDLGDAVQALMRFGLFTLEHSDQLQHLDTLTPEELASFSEMVRQASKRIVPAEATREDVQMLSASAAVINACKGETARRTKAAETLQTTVTAGAAAVQAATVRLPRIGQLAARSRNRVTPSPLLTASAASVLTASGQEITDLADSLGAQVRSLWESPAQPNGRDHRVLARIRRAVPDDRFLSRDVDSNAERIAAVTSPTALAASGGICAPVAANYEVQQLAVSDRPAQGAMALFTADRGGLRYTLPHTLAGVTADGPSAIWTEANDVNPTNPATKPHALFQCNAPQEAYTDAVTSITQFGNFSARFFPEAIAQYLETADAVHARLAEGNLLAQLSAGSTQVNADAYELGASRDLLAVVDRATAAMRFRHRMAPTTPLRLVIPAWLRAMVRTDLARQLPGDSGSGAERLAVADAQIDLFFTARSVNVTDVWDSPITGGPVLQGWGTQGPGQLLPWPAQTAIWLYPEGSWLFLDGGELNLGMVRDSLLNRTNDLQMFMETFEKAIFLGHESQQINMKLAPTGASAGTVATGSVETIGS